MNQSKRHHKAHFKPNSRYLRLIERPSFMRPYLRQQYTSHDVIMKCKYYNGSRG